MEQRDVARSTNYLMTIGENRDVTFAAQSSNITEVLLGQAPYPNGPKDMFLPGNKLELSPLTVQLLVSEDYREWLYFYKWMLKLKNNDGTHLTQTKPCALQPLDSQNRPIGEFVYTDCFPTDLGSLEMSIQGESISLVTTVSFRYNRFKFVHTDGTEIADDWNGEL